MATSDKMVVRRIPPGELIEDFNLYPRHHRDPQNVRDIAEAYRAGAELPPVRCTQDLRLVDGWHRKDAWQRVHGENPMPAEPKVYESDAEAFLDAVSLNAHHGRKLDRRDVVRVIEHGDSLALDPKRLAAALSMTVETMGSLGQRIAYAANGTKVALKAGTRHLAGQTLSDEQLAGLEKSAGHSPLWNINQVRNLLERDLVDWENERYVQELCRLRALLADQLEGRCD